MTEEKKNSVLEYLRVIIAAIVLLLAVGAGYADLSVKVSNNKAAALQLDSLNKSQEVRLKEIELQIKRLPILSFQAQKNTEDIKALSTKIDQNTSILIELRSMMRVYLNESCQVKKRRGR